jgi:hypothetical protein
MEREAEANEQYQEAQPALKAAKDALERVSQKDLSDAKTNNKPSPVVEFTFRMGYHLWLEKGKGHTLDTDTYDIVKIDFLCASGLLDALKKFPVEKLRKEQV